MQRTIGAIVLVSLLVGLIVYSQQRATPLKVSGLVEADEIRLGSRVGGRVSRVFVEEGQAIRAGERLVEFEPFDLLELEHEAVEILAQREAELRLVQAGLRQEEIAQAKARNDQLQARLDLLEAGPRQQEIRAAKGRLQVAEAELRLARQIHDRQTTLLVKQAVSRDEVDRAIERLQAAVASVEVRRQELELLKAGTREETKREAQAEVEQARQA